MAENPETSKPETENLLSQALGLVTGVLAPKFQLYSSQKILTEILAPLNSFKFYSLEQACKELEMETGTCELHEAAPYPTEVRDSSNAILFRFLGMATGQLMFSETARYGRPAYMAVLVDPLQRQLLYAKPILGFAIEYNLTCKEGVVEQSFGKVSIPDQCSCDLSYSVTAVNLFTGQVAGPLMEANGTSSNCCCSSTETILFGCPNRNGPPVRGNLSGILDPRVVGEMKRIANSISNNPNGTSQVNFDPHLPIVYKIWILFISYHIHYRNFANTAISRNGQRGSIIAAWHAFLWPMGGLLLLLLMIPLFIMFRG